MSAAWMIGITVVGGSATVKVRLMRYACRQGSLWLRVNADPAPDPDYGRRKSPPLPRGGPSLSTISGGYHFFDAPSRPV